MASLQQSVINDTGFLKLPSGTTAQRPTAAVGQIRYNTDLKNLEGYVNGGWQVFAAGCNWNKCQNQAQRDRNLTEEGWRYTPLFQLQYFDVVEHHSGDAMHIFLEGTIH
jgi:hypothetical protein